MDRAGRELAGDGNGALRVVTGESAYLLDLGRRTVVRLPGEDAERRRGDGEIFALVKVVRCEIGQTLLVVRRGTDGLSRPLQSSSPVCRIEPTVG